MGDNEIHVTKPRRRETPTKGPLRPPRDQPSPEAGDDFYRDMVWSMRNGVIAIRPDDTVTVVNDIAYRILGLTPETTDVGRPFSEVLRDAPEIAQVLASAFDLSHLPNRAELRLQASGRVIGYTLSRVVDRSGRLSGAALFFKDLTRVERIEERERLRDRLAALGEMAAAIAHEVKNPLAGIQVTAGVLKRQLSESTDAQGLLADIINEAKMANTIVVQVLEFVRPINLQVERTSVPDVLRDAIMRSDGHGTRGKVDIVTRVDDALPEIQGDHMQLRQLFTNLLINAFEALEGRGLITLAARFTPSDEDPAAPAEPPDTGGSIVIEVDDNGPGIPSDVTEKIFSPFFTTKPRGSGLGLAIVRKIVDAHDGRIDVRRRSAGGTRFQITLPVAGEFEDGPRRVDRSVH